MCLPGCKWTYCTDVWTGCRSLLSSSWSALSPSLPPASDHVELMPWASPASPFASCHFRRLSGWQLVTTTSKEAVKFFKNTHATTMEWTPSQWLKLSVSELFHVPDDSSGRNPQPHLVTLQLLVCHLPAGSWNGWNFCGFIQSEMWSADFLALGVLHFQGLRRNKTCIYY